MKQQFEHIRRALEEYLSAINENTSEIQALFDYLREFELKVDKLSQRLDWMQLEQGKPLEKPAVAPLNQTEKNVFLVLYTEDTPLSYQEIAMKSNVPLALIPECISSLVDKGIPFTRSFVNKHVFLRLAEGFKERQARENLINLSLQSFIDS